MTRALGVEPEVPVDLFVEEASPGDRFLLCSDGLPRELSDDRISAILRRLADPSGAARELVHEAKRHGGNDNITVIVIDVLEGHTPQHYSDQGSFAVPGGEAADIVVPVHGYEPDAGETKILEVVTIASPDAGDHRVTHRAKESRSALITLRVAAFMATFVLIVAAGAVGVWYYARSTYFVGVKGNTLAVYQGRPGGVLWIEPTLNHLSTVTTAQVLQASLPSLNSGVEEPTVAAADAYIANLAALYQKSQAASQPPPPTPTTTAPSTTTSTGGSASTISAPTTS
jgi:protein phosphatase